jgi:hypothetical protein
MTGRAIHNTLTAYHNRTGCSLENLSAAVRGKPEERWVQRLIAKHFRKEL